jgi:endonuclease/exonuclease/phosphatase (EEP) superfamily protein YafD
MKLPQLPKHKPRAPSLQSNDSAWRQAAPLPSCFTLLVWNLQKTHAQTLKPSAFARLLETALPVHLFALQEARVNMKSKLGPFNAPFIMASNIQTRQNHFGVMTASRHPMTLQTRFLTQKREAVFATFKSALLSRHSIQTETGEASLWLLNLHAMIFVPFFVFKKELQKLVEALKSLPSNAPLIVAGDFNTWSNRRQRHLDKILASLNLTKVPIENAHFIKSIKKHPLDHIYYRGLTLKKARAYNVPDISDHNPLYAEFCYESIKG